MKYLAALAAILLGACEAPEIEGTYDGGDGEGTRVSLILSAGRAQFWQGDTDRPPLRGNYHQEGEQVILTLAGRRLALTFDGNCLYPTDDPTQKICRSR